MGINSLLDEHSGFTNALSGAATLLSPAKILSLVHGHAQRAPGQVESVLWLYTLGNELLARTPSLAKTAPTTPGGTIPALYDPNTPGDTTALFDAALLYTQTEHTYPDIPTALGAASRVWNRITREDAERDHYPPHSRGAVATLRKDARAALVQATSEGDYTAVLPRLRAVFLEPEAERLTSTLSSLYASSLILRTLTDTGHDPLQHALTGLAETIVGHEIERMRSALRRTHAASEADQRRLITSLAPAWIVSRLP